MANAQAKKALKAAAKYREQGDSPSKALKKGWKDAGKKTTKGKSKGSTNTSATKGKNAKKRTILQRLGI